MIGVRRNEAQVVRPPEGGRWTAEAVQAELEHAFDVLKRLPGRTGPDGFRCGMPEVLRSIWDAYDWNAADARLRPASPAPEEIDRATVVVAWLTLIESQRDRRVVAARCFGARWRMIERFDGRTREHLQRQVFRRALEVVATRLNHQMYAA